MVETTRDLVSEFLPLVIKTSKRFNIPNLELEDKVQTCFYYMVKALPFYEGRNSCSLRTYLLVCIRNGLVDEQRKYYAEKRIISRKTFSLESGYIQKRVNTLILNEWRYMQHNI